MPRASGLGGVFALARSSRRKNTGRTSRSRQSSSSSRKRKELSREALENLYRAVEARIVLELGLEDYGIPADVLREILEPIVYDIATAMSRPTEDGIVKKIVGNRQALLKAVAARILESPEKLDRRKLEFAMQHLPELVGRLAPIIYDSLQSVVRDESIAETLKILWESYGSPTLARCPRCGFKSLMPDLTCTVCGYTSSEEEFKRSIGLDSILDAWASKSDPSLVREVIAASLVYYEDGELKPPSQPRNPLAIPITLGRREKSLLSSKIT